MKPTKDHTSRDHRRALQLIGQALYGVGDQNEFLIEPIDANPFIISYRRPMTPDEIASMAKHEAALATT